MRKTRIDKGEDRINTRTKYTLYALGALIAGYAYGYSYGPVKTEVVYRESRVSCKEEIVCHTPPPVIKYVVSECTVLTK